MSTISDPMDDPVVFWLLGSVARRLPESIDLPAPAVTSAGREQRYTYTARREQAIALLDHLEAVGPTESGTRRLRRRLGLDV